MPFDVLNPVLGTADGDKPWPMIKVSLPRSAAEAQSLGFPGGRSLAVALGGGTKHSVVGVGS